MAIWTDCNGGPNFFGGFACDMGPYIGPWPMLATGEIAGLGPWDEIDFVLGYPNPAHPGDAYYGLDGTYDSPIWVAYRYVNGGTPPPDSFDDYYTSSVGAATDPAPGDTPPPGMHLYVVGYTTGAPPNPPEFYVPGTYCAAGASAVQTNLGGWSPWQAGTDHSVVNQADGGALPGDWQGTAWGSGGVNAFENVPSYVNLQTLGQSAIDAVVPSAAASAGGPAGGIIVIGGAKNPDPFSFGAVYTQANFTLNQVTAAFNARVSNPNPIPFGSPLVFGVDYAPRPYYGVDYEYESADPAVFTWGPVHVETSGGTPGSHGTGGAVMPLSGDMRYDLLTGPVAPGTTGLVVGTEFASVALHSDDTVPSGHTFGPQYDLTLPPGADADPRIVVSVAPRFLYDGLDDAVFPDLSPAGDYGWVMNHAFYGIDYDWTTSQWRYWKANTIGPALAWRPFTAGAFDTGSGATLYINTPGLGLVPVLDGPG